MYTGGDTVKVCIRFDNFFPFILPYFFQVKKMFAQVIIAMADHDFLSLEGGHQMVEFIVRQCALYPDVPVIRIIASLLWKVARVLMSFVISKEEFYSPHKILVHVASCDETS